MSIAVGSVDKARANDRIPDFMVGALTITSIIGYEHVYCPRSSHMDTNDSRTGTKADES
jgi:hypothetical protein